MQWQKCLIHMSAFVNTKAFADPREAILTSEMIGLLLGGKSKRKDIAKLRRVVSLTAIVRIAKGDLKTNLGLVEKQR